MDLCKKRKKRNEKKKVTCTVSERRDSNADKATTREVVVLSPPCLMERGKGQKEIPGGERPEKRYPRARGEGQEERASEAA